MRVALLLSVALLSACQPAKQAPKNRQQTQAILDGIADRCGVPRDAWELVGQEHLRLRPAPDTPYQKVDCLLSGLEKSKLPVRLGFIGNEAYPGNGQ